MDIHVIENEDLKISILDTGAELCSVFDKKLNMERIWTADASVWNRHAPILFPFVGKVIGGKYRVNGKEYEMKTQHGFARDMEFQCVNENASSVTHLLLPTEDTRAIYPFEYSLLVSQSLDPNNPRRLIIEWIIENRGDCVMYYSIGGHPGFLMPPGVEKESCLIAFPGCRELQFFSANQAGFALPNEIQTLFLNDEMVQYRQDIPATWIFPDHQVKSAGIMMPDGKPWIMLNCEQFPLLAVWANPKGPFICLEPWFGRTDDEGFSGTLAEKPGMEILNPGDSRQIAYSIEFFC